MVAAKQRDTTQKHREAGQAAQAAQSAQPAKRTPLVGRSTLFVTESDPGTPNPAETFQALQRDFEEKRRSGVLTWQEEIEFERAQATEKARVLKERLDQAYDGSDASVADEEDPRMSPSVASLPDEDDDDEPKKRGRKRKADPISKPQPKKRRAAVPQSAEDILVTARRKIEAKAKAKAAASKGKKQAPKKGRKPKPTAPDLLNTAGMLGSNVFNDVARMGDVPDQPVFGTDHENRKDKALRSLIASVPEEYRPVAKTDKKFLEDAMKDFTGRGAVTPADDGHWAVKGMRCHLKSYQILGTAFMRKRENASSEPKGGILADSMGLGKKITMLTNIVNGKSLQKGKCRTTLIVASAALVSQWRQEIADKVYTDRESKHGIGRVREYHATAQLKSNQELEELMECDIVLTTYTQVQKSYPKAEIPAEYTTAEQKNEWWKKHFEKEQGPLHRIKWFRIVLDEAQAIKNHKSLTSLACRALSAKHNWAISGTPLLNGIEEFYSLFKFIKGKLLSPVISIHNTDH
jgi:SNF2 family DNA or RNA helicase